jgi:hypothetical protein
MPLTCFLPAACSTRRRYGHNGLGAYLIKKGADDTAVNHQGLTVYEGI